MRRNRYGVPGILSGYKPDCSALTASFNYDALGRRISKTINGTTTQFVYDGWDITQEIKAGVKTNYIRTLNIDEPLTRVTGSTVRHYVTDALGSVVALTDDSGAVKTTYVYDAFGNATVSGENTDNPFQFAGRENDGTGLLLERYRYYIFELQRYASEDPIRLAGGDINFYVRVKSNPVNKADPFGLFDWGFGGIIGPFNFSWNSSNPYETHLSVVTDLEIGGGLTFCFDNPFKQELDQCGGNVPKIPFDLNVGTGKYTGISTNNEKMCINIGPSIGLTPIDISIPVPAP